MNDIMTTAEIIDCIRHDIWSTVEREGLIQGKSDEYHEAVYKIYDILDDWKQTVLDVAKD